MVEEFEVFKSKYQEKIKSFVYNIEIDESDYEKEFYEPDINRDVGLAPGLNTAGLIKQLDDQKSKAIECIKSDGIINYIELSDDMQNRICSDESYSEKVDNWAIKIVEGL